MTAQAWNQTRDFIARWYSIPLLLLLWQLAVGSGLVESRLLPGPGRVLTALVTDVGNGTLVYHASVTLYRALTGFLLAALIGIPFAVAMARSGLVRNLFEPIFSSAIRCRRSRCFRCLPIFLVSARPRRSRSPFSNASIRSW
jgi:ABC-type nitrate/sulfonate/bicarbonate transport system permease component